jgi:hypothetical protein
MAGFHRSKKSGLNFSVDLEFDFLTGVPSLFP